MIHEPEPEFRFHRSFHDRGDCICCPGVAPSSLLLSPAATGAFDDTSLLSPSKPSGEDAATALFSPRSAKVAYAAELSELGLHGFLARLSRQGEAFTALSLAENEIGDRGAMVLRDVLSNNQYLRRLNLTHTGLGYAGFEEVGALLKDCLSLEVLVLNGNQPGTGPLPADFCKGFQLAPSLKALHLSDCGLTAASLRPLCAVLRGCECGLALPLERLSLSHNQLDAAAMHELSSFLERNETLRILDLSANSLGYKGAELLAKDLSKLPRSGLRRLHLDRNGLELRGCRALARLWAAAGGPPLEHLDLRDNGCTEAQCAEVAHLLGKPPGTVLQFDRGGRVLLSWRDLQGRMARRPHGGHVPMNVYWDDR